MNQNQQRRQRRRQSVPWFSLSLIGMVAVIVVPVFQRGTAAIAHIFSSGAIAQQDYYWGGQK
jgi:hypothetical protein